MILLDPSPPRVKIVYRKSKRAGEPASRGIRKSFEQASHARSWVVGSRRGFGDNVINSTVSPMTFVPLPK